MEENEVGLFEGILNDEKAAFHERERERERESLCVCEDEGDDAKAKESFEGLILRTKHFHLSFLWCSNGEYSVSIGHFALPNLPHTFS